MLRLPVIAPFVLVVAALFTSGCSEPVDLQQALEVTDVTTGWYDAGIVKDPEGTKNKLVPTISFRLKNKGDKRVSGVQINAIFRRIGEEEEWGSAWVRGIGSEGLAPGETSEPLVLRAQLGYLGLQPRHEMLQNKEFIDARVEVFGKHGPAQWVKILDQPIERLLLTE